MLVNCGHQVPSVHVSSEVTSTPHRFFRVNLRTFKWVPTASKANSCTSTIPDYGRSPSALRKTGRLMLAQLARMVIPRGSTDWTIGFSLTLLNYCLVFFNFCLFGFAFILNFITCMCVDVSVCVCICWGHMTTFRSLFSSTVWVLGTELRQSCLARAFLNGSSLVLSPLFLSPTTTSSFFFLPLFYFLAFFKHVALSLLQL